MQRAQARTGAQFLAAHRGERVAHPGDYLGHGQIDVGELRTDHPGARRIALEYPLEIAEELGQADGKEVLRTALRRRFLLLVGIAAAERAMGAAHPPPKIANRETHLMRPEPTD